MTKFKSTLSRRSVLVGMAASASALAMPAILTSRALAAPGSNPGKYKLDLGGYTGPELTNTPITLKIMRQEFPPEVNDVLNAQYAEFSAAYPNITIQEERVPYQGAGLCRLGRCARYHDGPQRLRLRLRCR
jgi:hypothetical protein